MVVEPATRDDGDAVEASDAGLGKQAGEKVTDDAADSMRSKDLDGESEWGRGEWVAPEKGNVDKRTSRQSSYWKRNLSCVAKLHKVPAMKPKSTAAAVSRI